MKIITFNLDASLGLGLWFDKLTMTVISDVCGVYNLSLSKEKSNDGKF
jgi:hypothetical protein